MIAEKKVNSCNPPACNISIYARIYFAYYGINNGRGQKRSLELGRPTVYTNYGNISVEQKHHASTVLNEILEINRPFWLNAVADFTVHPNFYVRFSYGWQDAGSFGPFVNEVFLEEHIPIMLRSNGSLYTLKQARDPSRENTVHLSPCTSYAANGTVEVITREFWFQLYAWVTGKDSDGNPVLATDLKEALPDGLSVEETDGDYDLLCSSYNPLRTVFVGSVVSNGYAAKLPNCVI